MFQLIQFINKISTHKLKLSILLISILIASQVQYIQHGWINPDSVLYLEAAKLFAIGQWKQGFDIFQWPFYSLWIAATHKLTGLGVHPSAQLLNVLFFAIATISFINIIVLAGGNKITMVAGAAILFSSSYVVGDVLEMLMRDEGFWAFYLTSLVFFIQFYKHQRYQDALLWQVSAVFAMLFRIEAIAYLIFLPLVLLWNTHYTWSQRFGQLAKANLLNLVVVIGIFTAIACVEQLSIDSFGRLREIVSANLWNEFTHNLVTRANIMSEEVLGHYLDEFAIQGLLLTFVFVMIVKAFSAAGAINVVLGFLAFRDKQYIAIDRDVTKILVTVGLISLINMGLIITKVFVLSTRYAVGLGFIIMLFASFSFAYLLRPNTSTTDKNASLKKWLTYLIVLLMLISLIKNVLPKREGYNYLQEAASWVVKNNPTKKPVFFDDLRVQFYTGAPYKTLGGNGWELLQEQITTKKIFEYELLVLSNSSKHPERNEYFKQQLSRYTLIKSFENDNRNKTVNIYRRNNDR